MPPPPADFPGLREACPGVGVRFNPRTRVNRTPAPVERHAAGLGQDLAGERKLHGRTPVGERCGPTPAPVSNGMAASQISEKQAALTLQGVRASRYLSHMLANTVVRL